MANKKLTTRLKNKTWTNPQIETMIRLKTQHKNPENTYLKSLTLLLPSVEKTVNLHAFK